MYLLEEIRIVAAEFQIWNLSK